MSKSTTKIINGVLFPPEWHDLVCLFWLFRHAPTLQKDSFAWGVDGKTLIEVPFGTYTGEGRFTHSRQIDEMLFPKLFEYHDWSSEALSTFCSFQKSAVCGCGGSGKSTSAGNYAWKFFQCDPLRSAVLIFSTTLRQAMRRIWKNVSAFNSEFVRLTGYRESSTVNSPTPSICPFRSENGRLKRDQAYGIHVVAVASGELQKGIDSAKGFHPERLLVIGDETDAISQAVVDVCDNLRIGCEEFQEIWLGNDPSMFNPLGKLMEPEIGKPVSLEHKEWTSIQNVHCLRFDGFDSPNIRDSNKWKGLITQENIDDITHNGVRANTPMAWIMVRGIHPPEGSDSTVLSEAAIMRFHCRDRVEWKGGFIISASLDAGFGGDPCKYRTFKRGDDVSGVLRVEIDEVIEIPIDANNKNTPAEYQIAAKVIELSKARGIPPEEFIASNTGTGRGAVAVLQREWSPRIQSYDEGGACSSLIVSDEDPRPAKEIYDRMITELYLSIREFTEADMIRNLDLVTANQLCNRRVEVKGTGSGKRDSLEKKEDMKARGLQSPNEADALAGYIQLLREKGINARPSAPARTLNDREVAKVEEEMDWDALPDLYAEEYV